MSSFTKGPWFIAGDGRFVYALNDRGVNAFSAHVQDAHTSDAELRSVARLIHASPDLLSALRGLLDSYCSLAIAVDEGAQHYKTEENVIASIAAIAKATGTTP